MSQTKGTLYLVATPIGNLEDITRRALRVLAEADVVACEDTRRTRALLEHFGIRAKTVSYHEHNERVRAVELAASLEGGATVALVSDAGTPGVSDPGYRLVRASVERGVRVVPVPGPSAFVAALTASGLPTDEFYFLRLPARASTRAPPAPRRSPCAPRHTRLLRSAAPHRTRARGRARSPLRAQGRGRARADETPRGDRARSPRRVGRALLRRRVRARRDGSGH